MKRDDTKKSFVHALCVLFFIGCVSFFVWQIGTGYTNWLDTSKTFDIQKIEIEGNDLLPEEDILKLAGITPAMSIWDVDLEKSEKKIGHNAFVTSVQLERFFPDRLHI